MGTAATWNVNSSLLRLAVKSKSDDMLWTRSGAFRQVSTVNEWSPMYAGYYTVSVV